MGNRAKRDMEAERISARMRAEDARRAALPDPTPRCACGRSHHDATLWAITDQQGRLTFRCAICLPDGPE